MDGDHYLTGLVVRGILRENNQVLVTDNFKVDGEHFKVNVDHFEVGDQHFNMDGVKWSPGQRDLEEE